MRLEIAEWIATQHTRSDRLHMDSEESGNLENLRGHPLLQPSILRSCRETLLSGQARTTLDHARNALQLI